jgi:hypothetical protein
VGVVVQLIGSGLSFVVILAVVARGCLLFGTLPNDAELVVGVLNNLLESLLKVHNHLLRWSVIGLVEPDRPTSVRSGWTRPSSTGRPNPDYAIRSLSACFNKFDQCTHQPRDQIPCPEVQQVSGLAGEAGDFPQGDEGTFENDGSCMLQRHA